MKKRGTLSATFFFTAQRLGAFYRTPVCPSPSLRVASRLFGWNLCPPPFSHCLSNPSLFLSLLVSLAACVLTHHTIPTYTYNHVIHIYYILYVALFHLQVTFCQTLPFYGSCYVCMCM